MIVVDLDGTLLNINGGCSRNAKRYLKKLKDLGYIVVIATGRILRDAINITDGAKFANYIISNSGGLIYDMDNSKLIRKNDILKEEVRRIFSFYNDEIDYIDVCDLFYYHRYKFCGKMDLFFDREIKDIDKFINDNDDMLHMIIKFKDIDLVDKYYKMFNSDNIKILVMQDSFADKKWLEIFGKGVSKYDAIKVLMEIEKIDNLDVITFGDGLNDVDMIRMAGVGVAMGNALDSVKDVANYVTISHNDDGVIYFLRRYLDRNNLVS